MELGYMIFTVQGMNFELVEVIEKHTLTLTLPSKDVDVIIDDTTCMTVSALWYLSRLCALYPS